MTANGSRNGVLPASLIVSLGLLFMSLFGAGWTIMQSGFSTIEKNIDINDRRYRDADSFIRSELEVIRTQAKTNYDANLALIKETIESLHNRVVGQAEFRQMEERLDSTLKRLDQIESTRPTTGELKSAADGLNERFNVVASRLGVMENRSFDNAAKSARNPVESSELVAQVNAVNKQLDSLQQQIIDLNRQIAASLLAVTTNSTVQRSQAPSPQVTK